MIQIFPAIDLLNGNCVRLVHGDYNQKTIYSNTPANQAKIWEQFNAPLIHLVDLDGAKTGAVTNSSAIQEICHGVHIPCELGGGIRSLADAERVFNLGVSRVILGTVICDNPKLAADFVKEFGAERIVGGIDSRNGKVATRGWLETSQTETVVLAKILEDQGICRFIFTDIATDGAMTGPNLDFLSNLCEALPNVKVIASGGITCKEDIRALAKLNYSNLEGAIVGKALYDGHTIYSDLALAGVE